LFFFNRYFTPLGFVINLHAYLSPSWSLETFVKYEGFNVALAVEVVGLMMLLRIRAIYCNQTWITILLSAILAIETGVNIWLISHAGPVVHSPRSGVRACSMVFDHSKPYTAILASSSAWIPLLYDTIVFGLTLRKTIPLLRRAQASQIIRRLFEDGILYYSVIFSVTLVLTIMIITAPEGTKNIAAQLEQLITVAMMSRITLNLRKVANQHHTQHLTSNPRHPTLGNWFLHLFPGTRRANGSIWEQTFPHFSFFDTSTSTHGDVSDVQLEHGDVRPDLGGYRRNSLCIQFAVPNSNEITPQTTKLGSAS